MDVLVDTSVWSLVLRRERPDQELSSQLRHLVAEGRVRMIGLIRQELLSGIRTRAHFDLLRHKLRAFPDIPLDEPIHEQAAELANTCLAKGIAPGTVDLLICAVAKRHRLAILTRNGNFARYSKAIGLTLLT
jgi:predicted nucleic acid-binding protein